MNRFKLSFWIRIWSIWWGSLDLGWDQVAYDFLRKYVDRARRFRVSKNVYSRHKELLAYSDDTRTTRKNSTFSHGWTWQALLPRHRVPLFYHIPPDMAWVDSGEGIFTCLVKHGTEWESNPISCTEGNKPIPCVYQSLWRCLMDTRIFGAIS